MKKVFGFLIVSLIIVALNSCSTQNPNPNNNGSSSCITTNYITVAIGGQVWMQKNLDVEHYRNGDAIPQVTDPTQWSNLTTGAWCYYNNETANCSTYGKLYNWYAVEDTRGLAPVGWHVASDAEWTTLADYLGGESVAGNALKEAGTSHWNSPNTGATNSSGFTALPGGFRYPNGLSKDLGYDGWWWTSTEDNATSAWSRIIVSNDSYLGRNSFADHKGFGYSVRCIKD